MYFGTSCETFIYGNATSVIEYQSQDQSLSQQIIQQHLIKRKTYHRTTTKKRERAKMAELVNNSGTSSVNIVLHMKSFD